MILAGLVGAGALFYYYRRSQARNLGDAVSHEIEYTF
jgi:hypothetical protein